MASGSASQVDGDLENIASIVHCKGKTCSNFELVKAHQLSTTTRTIVSFFCWANRGGRVTTVNHLPWSLSCLARLRLKGDHFVSDLFRSLANWMPFDSQCERTVPRSNKQEEIRRLAHSLCSQRIRCSIEFQQMIQFLDHSNVSRSRKIYSALASITKIWLPPRANRYRQIIGRNWSDCWDELFVVGCCVISVRLRMCLFKLTWAFRFFLSVLSQAYRLQQSHCFGSHHVLKWILSLD